MVNVLLRADPSRVRTPSERAQADEIYRLGQSLKVRDRLPALRQQPTNGRTDPTTEGAFAGASPTS